MRIKQVVFVAFLILCLMQICMPLSAWSVEGHAVVATRAIRLLPQPWRTFFQYYGGLVNETVAYPDTLYRGNDPSEAPRHFVDLEVWNPNLPSTGTLPESVNEFTGKMETAIRNKDWNAMFLHAGRVAHYMADDAQPYHSTKNYNPTTKNGVGLHQVLDSSMIDHLAELRVIDESQVGQLTPIKNLTQFALDTAIQSHSFLPVINRTLINDNLPWSSELTMIIENRTNTAIIAVARVWLTAIVNANVSPPEIPQTNSLSIMMESFQINQNGVRIIRVGVVDALGIKTRATVTLTVDGATSRGQVANVIPPVGEYVIVLGAGNYSGGFTVRAQKTGYASGVLEISTNASTLQQIQTYASVRSTSFDLTTVNVSTVQLAVLSVLIVVVLALWFRRRFRGS